MKVAIPARVSVLIALLAIAGTGILKAEIRSKSNDLIVMEPGDLPELAQLPGNSLFLYQDNHGSSFLYVEQQQGARLTVFDVTEPSKVIVVSSTKLDVPGAFDFVRPLGESAELIRFRDDKGVAALDLHKPKVPAFHIINSLEEPGPTETLGETGLLFINEPYNYIPAQAHDYQVVDLSYPSEPVLFTTIKQVKHRVGRDETGTTYVLGSAGLTVIRRPRVEEDYKAHQRATSGN
jgi:hypothetical protein